MPRRLQLATFLLVLAAGCSDPAAPGAPVPDAGADASLPGDVGSADVGPGDLGGADPGRVDAGDPERCETDKECIARLSPLPDCVEARCDKATRVCQLRPLPGQPACDDASACTTDDRCLGGTCVGTKLACGDDNPCTEDTCSPGLGCLFVNLEGPCDDGDLCTTNDRCQSGACAGDANPLCECSETADCAKFEDGDQCNGTLVCLVKQCLVDEGTLVTCPPATEPCRESRCDPDTGQCLQGIRPDGTACDDGDACTVGDTCSKGECVGQKAPCDDGNPCTEDGCAPATGCTATPTSGACDDGDLCTTGDACVDGACVGTADPACDCSADADCKPYEDGNLCNGTLVCAGGGCKVDPATVITCAATALPCREVTCVAATGACSDKAVLDGTTCDDGNACTSADQCLGGACLGLPVACDDGIACTDDSCDPLSGCVNEPSTAPCDDGDPCTTGDVCADGACVGTPDPACACASDSDCVDDGNLCNGTLVCQGGQCVKDPATVVQCTVPPGVACHEAVCIVDTGACKLVPRPDGQACDDGNACTVAEVCLGGICVGAPRTCDDGNVCTTDSCNPLTGCTAQYNSQPCDDGSGCTSGDTCSEGACVGTPVPQCVCDADADCQEFEDGDPCNGTLRCAGSKCVVDPATVVVCDTSGDGPCASTACDPATGGCVQTLSLEGKPCDDGDACTRGDACAAGACEASATLGCDDGDPCTADACDAELGCVHGPADDAPCDDGDPCTTGDLCGDALCLPGAVNACPGSCFPDYALECGGQDTWSTALSGVTDVVTSYPCAPGWDYPAPEYGYVFTAPYTGTFTVKLSNETAITDALILKAGPTGCDPQACVAVAEGSATVPMVAGETFHVVVDGWGDASQVGQYTISVGCVPQAEAKCGDGVDEDQDGATDCADPDCDGAKACAAPTCGAAVAIGCGQSDTWGNAKLGATDAADAYGCNSYDYAGPEFAYRFVAPADGDVTVRLTAETANTDLLVLEEAPDGACDPAACVDWSLGSAVTFAAAAGDAYLLVVDGYQEAKGQYTIHVDCPTSAPPCSADADCEGQTLCGPLGVCVAGCLTADDCAAGQACLGIVCAAACATDADCGAGHTCEGGYCATACATAADCLDGYACDQGRCTVPCGTESDCPDSWSCVAGGAGSLCSPEPAPAPTCTPQLALACGDTDTWETVGEAAAMSDYACLGWSITGPEFVYSFTPQADAEVTFALTSADVDLDLVVLEETGGGCSPDSCVTGDDASAVFQAKAGTTYYLVVDGYEGVAGLYSVALTCQ